jgi:hypothetical protein
VTTVRISTKNALVSQALKNNRQVSYAFEKEYANFPFNRRMGDPFKMLPKL